MTPERWAAIREAFEASRELEPAARAALLAGSALDEVARAEVASLLAADAVAGSFLERPPFIPPPLPAAEPLGQVGAWRLVEEIGRGGMGTVFRAERDDGAFRMAAAVKLVPAGTDREAILSRFQAERQILAHLEHPHIARLLDGGAAPDGRPFIVMELVDGQPIDVHCRERRLDLAGRLRLFAQVCDAVQYAHRRLVVHRDLKPANILVTADGVPKLLDFGIAKLIEPTAGDAVTIGELRAFTPRYASPEQARGDLVTPATDVYSLGVLLHELLTGRPPYQLPSGGPLAQLEALARAEPTRPSAAAGADGPVPARALLGDLDWIVLKALHREPERRYATAGELAGDVRRHLAGQPVEAGPDALSYRAAKFARRHRVAVSAAALVLAAVVAGLVATLVQWRRAERARAEAEQRYDDVRRLAGSLLFELHGAIERLPGSTRAQELVVARATEYLDRLAASSPRPEVRIELAEGYRKLSLVQGRYGLGDSAGGVVACRKAVALAEPLGAAPGAPPAHRLTLARAWRQCATELRSAGHGVEADRLSGSARALLEALLAAEPGLAGAQSELAGAAWEEGNTAVDRGDWAAALAQYQRAAGLYAALGEARPDKITYRQDLALTLRNQAGVSLKLQAPAQARDQAVRAVATSRALLAGAPDDAELQLDLAVGLGLVAAVERDAGRPADALAPAREALALAARVSGRDAENVFALEQLAAARAQVALGLAAQGDAAEAIAEQRRAVADRGAVAGRPGAGPGSALELAESHAVLGDLLAPGRGGAGVEACRSWGEARRLYAASAGDLPAAQRPIRDGLWPRLARCDVR